MPPIQQDIIINLKVLSEANKLANDFRKVAEANRIYQKAGVITSKTGERFYDISTKQRISMNELANRTLKARDALKKEDAQMKYATKNAKRFKFEYLGIMFAGQRIAKTMESLIAPTAELFGIQEMFGLMMQDIMLPVMEPLAEMFYSISEEIMNMDDSQKKMIGGAILAAFGFGKLLDILGSLTLAGSSLSMVLGGLGVMPIGITGELPDATGFLAGAGLASWTGKIASGIRTALVFAVGIGLIWGGWDLAKWSIDNDSLFGAIVALLMTTSGGVFIGAKLGAMIGGVGGPVGAIAGGIIGFSIGISVLKYYWYKRTPEAAADKLESALRPGLKIPTPIGIEGLDTILAIIALRSQKTAEISKDLSQMIANEYRISANKINMESNLSKAIIITNTETGKQYAINTYKDISSSFKVAMNSNTIEAINSTNMILSTYDKIPTYMKTIHETVEITSYGGAKYAGAVAGVEFYKGPSGQGYSAGFLEELSKRFPAGLPAGYSLQYGGIIPGPPTMPVPIIAHGGERVIPAKEAGYGTINLYVSYSINVSDKREMETMIRINNDKLVSDLRRMVET